MIPLDLKFPLICLPFRAIRLCGFRSPSRSSFLAAAAVLQKHNSRILNHLRTLQKTAFPATPFPIKALRTLCKNTGVRGPSSHPLLKSYWRVAAIAHPGAPHQTLHTCHSHSPSIPNPLNRLRTVSVTGGVGGRTVPTLRFYFRSELSRSAGRSGATAHYSLLTTHYSRLTTHSAACRSSQDTDHGTRTTDTDHGTRAAEHRSAFSRRSSLSSPPPLAPLEPPSHFLLPLPSLPVTLA